VVWEAVYFSGLILMLFGPANEHTANDNTSGVITLVEIMSALPEEEKDSFAFVFFDLEETGLIGSSAFAKKHKVSMKNKLLLNFDCVSDGNNILLALKKGAKGYAPLLEKCFAPNESFKIDVRSKNVFYPSDQAKFNCGVGITALKYSKLLRTEYMDRIHTLKDTVFEEENIEFLKNCTLCLADELTK
jgi:Zn-dependent M28 family amino/carboxypeptidase